jgi:membrane protein
MVFTVLYIIMPNTKVNIVPAIIAGIVAGSLYQIFQWTYIAFQVGAARYNAIYGSFAALPLFLIWLQTSWMVVMLGAEIAYAIQNVEKYGISESLAHMSALYKRQLALLISHLIVKRFTNADAALTSDQISKKLHIPPHLTKLIVHELVETHICSAVRTEKENVFAYQPAIDVNRLTVRYILDTLESKGKDNISVSHLPEYHKIKEIIDVFNKSAAEMPENKLLKDI